MSVDSNPPSLIQSIGIDVTVTCTVVLSSGSELDVPVTVDIQISSLNPAVGQLTVTTSKSSFTYSSSARISSFGRDKSGIYNCSVMVSSTSRFLKNNSQFITTRVTTGIVNRSNC